MTQKFNVHYKAFVNDMLNMSQIINTFMGEMIQTVLGHASAKSSEQNIQELLIALKQIAMPYTHLYNGLKFKLTKH